MPVTEELFWLLFLYKLLKFLNSDRRLRDNETAKTTTYHTATSFFHYRQSQIYKGSSNMAALSSGSELLSLPALQQHTHSLIDRVQESTVKMLLCTEFDLSFLP